MLVTSVTMPILSYVLFTEVPDDFDYLTMLRKKHERLFQQGLNETHYDRFMGYLVDSFHSLGVQGSLLEEAEHSMRFIRDIFSEGSNAGRY
jgi:hypothetical protein